MSLLYPRKEEEERQRLEEEERERQRQEEERRRLEEEERLRREEEERKHAEDERLRIEQQKYVYLHRCGLQMLHFAWLLQFSDIDICKVLPRLIPAKKKDNASSITLLSKIQSYSCPLSNIPSSPFPVFSSSPTLPLFPGSDNR